MFNPKSEDVVAELVGVREYVEGEPVELVRNQRNGRLVIRAYNECGNNYTEIDLFDLMAYLDRGLDGRHFDGD